MLSVLIHPVPPEKMKSTFLSGICCFHSPSGRRGMPMCPNLKHLC
uniref:Uncharacterized protein n=1 Tax=Siphoviridae sp. ct87j35 TaxID=2825356 RepID=A0A8S5V4X4_9CAUD|nr:MAG TPA: hypothetical protein [Siphoviridae sp. ct87j35]